MRSIILSGALFLYLGTQICFAQASQSSEFTFTGNGDWYAEDLITRSDGTIVQLLRQQEGFYDKILILQSDTLGQIAWAQVWGNNEEVLRPRKIVQLPNGNLIVAATYFNPFQGGAELALLYMAADGSILRQAVYATFAAENIWDILPRDRKSTRLNSSHTVISYAVFCLKKKKKVKHQSLCI